MTLQIYVRYLVSSPCVVTPGGLETKRPVSELYGRSGGPAAPRVTITSSPASAGLFLVRFRTILVGTDFCRSRSSSTGRTGRWAVTTKAEEYRAKARECEELAEQTRDSFIKEQFLEVAKKWRQMAEHEDNR